MEILPQNYSPCGPCVPQCPEGVVPGPQGDPGDPGAVGVGINAYTVTSTSFVVPASGDNVTVAVGETGWMVVGSPVFIQSAGFYQVASITDETDVVLTNLGYPENAAPATTIATAQPVAPTGFKGADGASGSGVTSVGLSVPAGFITTGSPVTSSGTLAITTDPTTLQNRFLGSPDGTTGAPSFRALVPGDIPSLPASIVTSGQFPIARGGTGQNTASTGFNALAPTTTKGDLIFNNGSGNGRLAVGTNGQVLTADSTAANGASWQTPASVVTNPNTRVTAATYSMLATDLMIGVSRAGTVNITLLPAPANGRLAIIKDRSGAASSNTITVSASGGDTIQGSATKTITTNYGYLSLYYDSGDAAWYTIGSA